MAPAPSDGVKTGAIRLVFLRTLYEALFGYSFLHFQHVHFFSRHRYQNASIDS